MLAEGYRSLKHVASPLEKVSGWTTKQGLLGGDYKQERQGPDDDHRA